MWLILGLGFTGLIALGFYGFIIQDLIRLNPYNQQDRVDVAFLMTLWLICAILFGILLGKIGGL